MGYSVYIIAIISYDLPKPMLGISIYFPKYFRCFNPFIFVFPHAEIINIEILFFFFITDLNQMNGNSWKISLAVLRVLRELV